MALSITFFVSQYHWIVTDRTQHFIISQQETLFSIISSECGLYFFGSQGALIEEKYTNGYKASALQVSWILLFSIFYPQNTITYHQGSSMTMQLQGSGKDE